MSTKPTRRQFTRRLLLQLLSDRGSYNNHKLNLSLDYQLTLTINNSTFKYPPDDDDRTLVSSNCKAKSEDAIVFTSSCSSLDGNKFSLAPTACINLTLQADQVITESGTTAHFLLPHAKIDNERKSTRISHLLTLESSTYLSSKMWQPSPALPQDWPIHLSSPISNYVTMGAMWCSQKLIAESFTKLNLWLLVNIILTLDYGLYQPIKTTHHFQESCHPQHVSNFLQGQTNLIPPPVCI